MVSMDPNKTAINNRISNMSTQLRDILPEVLLSTGYKSELSLNAHIGSKVATFVDVKNDIIYSPSDFVAKYFQGFKKCLSTNANYKTNFDDLYDVFNQSKLAQEYMIQFLQRSYLKRYNEFSKKRPAIEEAEIWIGQNASDYGLLVSPRFCSGNWENDKSEIRRFKSKYWSIGHVISTGLVIPGKDKIYSFFSIQDYLNFFENVIVRQSKSKYQTNIAASYSNYVLNAKDPLLIPLLIPELRYAGREAKHKYRLDFCIIDGVTMERIGFEFSPSSSHTVISGTKNKTQKQINVEAATNFENEMEKQKSYFKRFGIFSLIYTDRDLKDMNCVFNDIKKYLSPTESQKALNFHALDNFFTTT